METIKTFMNHATDYKGERITVSVDGDKKIYPYEYKLNALENHKRAVWKAVNDLNKSHRQQFDVHKALKDIDHINGERGLIIEF